MILMFCVVRLGNRGATPILGVCLVTAGAGQPAPDAHHPSDTRETLHLRLRDQTHKGQGGCWYH